MNYRSKTKIWAKTKAYQNKKIKDRMGQLHQSYLKPWKQTLIIIAPRIELVWTER